MVGTVVDSYHILDVVGKGGMGVVYKALDTALDKVVALKVMNPALADDDDLLRRFKAEARALGRLQHPHIVTVFAFRQAPPFLLIVTEYVEGGTLTDLIKRGGALPWQTAVPLMRQVLEAIAHAHRQKIIHRDIKPGNILLTETGVVKVTDFGLAKIQALAADGQATSTEFAAGTLGYMPPEQLEGLSRVDQRGDVYALGMTFYEMLAGGSPFRHLASPRAIQKALYNYGVPALEQGLEPIPAPLVQMIMKALACDPDDRYVSADAMLAALNAWETGSVSGEASRAKSGLRFSLAAWTRKPPRGPAETEILLTSTPSPELVVHPPRRQRPVGRPRPSVYKVASVVASVLLFGVLLWPQRAPVAPPTIASQTVVAEPAPAAPAEATPTSTREKPTPTQGNLPLQDNPPQPLLSTVTEQPSEEPEEAAVERIERQQEAVEPDMFLRTASADLPTAEVKAPVLQQGTLRIKPSPWGNVYVDGEPSAYEIDYWYTLTLPARSHRITVRNPVLGRTWEAELTPAPSDTQEVVVDFMARVSVSIAAKDTNGRPVFGEIYIDGEPTGDWSPRKISVYPGLHRFEVRAEGYTQQEVRRVGSGAFSAQRSPFNIDLNSQGWIIHVLLKKTEDV